MRVPVHTAAACPVESKCTLQKNCHISKEAAGVFGILMTTHGNGDLCIRLLHNAVDMACLERVTICCSHGQAFLGSVRQQCIEKDGKCMRACPSLGDAVQDTSDAASSDPNTRCNISVHDRHAREMQAAKCKQLCAEDHTHEATKNCFGRKQSGALAL